MSSIERKISRNVLKKMQNNNRIKFEWKKFQEYKYSYGELQEINKKIKGSKKNGR